MLVKEEISYLRGLIEGGALEQPDKRSEIWNRLLNVFDGLIESMDSVTQYQMELAEYVEALDEDLDVLEAQVMNSQVDDEEEENKLGND